MPNAQSVDTRASRNSTSIHRSAFAGDVMPSPLSGLTDQARVIGRTSSCLPPDHPVWGQPGSAGARRNYESCLESQGTFFGFDPRPGFAPIRPGEAPRMFESPLGLGPVRVATTEDSIRLGICEGDARCLEFITASDPIYGPIIQLERLERGVKPVLTASDFQTDEQKAALRNEFATNPIANASLTAALRGDTGVNQDNLFAEPTGVSGNAPMIETMMVPPAPDMGGVWDSRTSAGDVDSDRAFNEPVRIGFGQAPLSYSSPFQISAPAEAGDDGLMLLIALAGLAFAIWG